MKRSEIVKDLASFLWVYYGNPSLRYEDGPTAKELGLAEEMTSYIEVVLPDIKLDPEQ